MQRAKLNDAGGANPAPRARAAFTPPPAAEEDDNPSNLEYLPSGSSMLDLVLAGPRQPGGWAFGRICNIVGDKSSGKTLLAIEACANMALLYGVENIRYKEGEAALDEGYARTIGMPKGLKPGYDIETVEQFDADLQEWLEKRKSGKHCLYVLDSLDSLSDTAEMERDMDKGSYGSAKAKKMSELFRKRKRLIDDRKCCLMIISQIRDKLNVTFGETKTRSGGRALDFYASQVIWLAEIQKVYRTISGVKRVVGVDVQARAKKNKVAPPFRDAQMTIQFNYGVDDEQSMLDWLVKFKFIGDMDRSAKEYEAMIDNYRRTNKRKELAEVAQELRDGVHKEWHEIEDALRPTMSKYGD